MDEKPLLVLSSKHFLAGVAPEAHSEGGPIFYKADGIMPLNNPGGTESTDNGLLRAGPAVTDLTGSVIVDAPVAKARNYTSGGSGFVYMLGASGHVYKLDPTSNTVTDLKAAGTANTANGAAIFQAKGGTKYFYYTQIDRIGRCDIDGTITFTDTWYSTQIDNTTQHPMHRYFDRILFGNNDTVGSISDNGAGDAVANSNVLDVPTNSTVTAISDDGVYAAIAITDNIQSANAFSNCKVLFWDGFADSWLREYTIDDQYILSLQRVGNSLVAQGVRGIYEISFGGGVNKILSRSTGLLTTGSNRQIGPALSSTYNQSAYVFGSTTSAGGVVATLGKISDHIPAAHFRPILTATTQVSLVEAQASAGKIFVATDSPKLYVYTFGGTTSGQTSVSAQTVYFPLGNKYQITSVDLIFGEPLASGDSVTLQLKSDEDTAASTAATASYDSAKTTRRKTLRFNGFVADEQLSLLLTFVSGVPKIKRIEVYGKAMTKLG